MSEVITPEKLAEIRQQHEIGGGDVMGNPLYAEIDRLNEENEALRAGLATANERLLIREEEIARITERWHYLRRIVIERPRS